MIKNNTNMINQIIILKRGIIESSLLEGRASFKLP